MKYESCTAILHNTCKDRKNGDYKNRSGTEQFDVISLTNYCSKHVIHHPSRFRGVNG